MAEPVRDSFSMLERAKQAVAAEQGWTPDLFPADCADGQVEYGDRCWHLAERTLEVTEIMAVEKHDARHDGHWSVPQCLRHVVEGQGRLFLLEHVFRSEEAALERGERLARESIAAARERERDRLDRLGPILDRQAALRRAGG